MSEEKVLEPKLHRSKTEIGRTVRNLVREHGEVRVTQGKTKYDIQIYIEE